MTTVHDQGTVLRPSATRIRLSWTVAPRRRRPMPAARLAAVAMGSDDLLLGSAAADGTRDHAEVVGLRAALVEVAVGHAGHRPRPAAARRAGTGETWLSGAPGRGRLRGWTLMVQGAAGTAEEGSGPLGLRAADRQESRPCRCRRCQPYHHLDGHGPDHTGRELTSVPWDVAGRADHHPVRGDAADPGAGRQTAGGPRLQRRRHRRRSGAAGVDSLCSTLRQQVDTVLLPVPSSAKQEDQDRHLAGRPARPLDRAPRDPARRGGPAVRHRLPPACAQASTRAGRSKVSWPSGGQRPPRRIFVVTSIALAAHFRSTACFHAAGIAHGITTQSSRSRVRPRVT